MRTSTSIRKIIIPLTRLFLNWRLKTWECFQMTVSFVDALMVLFAVCYNITLIVVYLFRAHEQEKLELKLAYFFSGFLIPFSLLWLVNLVGGSGAGRLLAGIPIIAYLVYDLWYRLITRKKPESPRLFRAGMNNTSERFLAQYGLV